MERERTIPVVVGVTGHRAIREKDRPALYAAVVGELKNLQARCPHSELLMLSSLAEGGDLLCAEAAAELGIPLVAALPVEPVLYARDFSPQARERLAFHLARAERVFVAPPTEAIPEGGSERGYRFRQAGIYVAAHSHVLLALWDGGHGTAAACGTAEAVDFCLRGSYYPADGVSLRSDSNEAVIHILTPRDEQSTEAAGSVNMLGNLEAVWEVLARTDEFNRLSRALPQPKRSLLPTPRESEPLLDRMEGVYLSASALSTAAAKTYRRALALLAVAGSLLTMAFLLYDEAQAIWMILVCGAMLLTGWGIQRFAARSDCHRRYIEYRALAECLRVQAFLRYAGSAVQAAEQLSWTQQEETAWIMDALCALNIAPPLKETHDIRGCWVDKQREYHEWSGGRDQRSAAVSERVVKTALILSVTLYVAAVVFEMCCGGLIFTPHIHVDNVELYRTVLKIAVGSLSAVTLFVASYYGRQSLPRRISDHTKMARFYARMSEQIENRGQTEALLSVLAREELIENGNWVSYQRDNAPEIAI